MLEWPPPGSFGTFVQAAERKTSMGQPTVRANGCTTVLAFYQSPPAIRALAWAGAKEKMSTALERWAKASVLFPVPNWPNTLEPHSAGSANIVTETFLR